jgi:hypothetical protein
MGEAATGVGRQTPVVMPSRLQPDDDRSRRYRVTVGGGAPRRSSAGTRDDGLPPDEELVARLRDGDEALFVRVVGRYHASLVRLAMRHVGSRAVAEEVVQDAWIGVLRGSIDLKDARASGRGSTAS